MSFLTMIQAAAPRCGLVTPTTAYANGDLQIKQLVALAQQEGIELMRKYDWPTLIKEKTFTSTAAAAQSGAIPSDFDRFVNETFYNRTQKRAVDGPISAQDWQFTQAVVSTRVVEAFRQRGSSILITPTPNGTDTYAYEYVSENFCQSNSSTEQAAWAADTDTGILDEEIMTDGIVWRFLRAKGMDYAEPFRTYEIMVAAKFAREGGARRLSMGARNYGGPRPPYVPEGSWSL